MGLTMAGRAKKELADGEVTSSLSYFSLSFCFVCPIDSLFAGYINYKQSNSF